MKDLKRIIFIMAVMLVILGFSNFCYNAKAMTIVLDPGHGGKDPGSLYGDIHEADMTLKIANYLKEYLDEYKDVNVILTHNGSTIEIDDRANLARNNKADLFVSIHINSSLNPLIQGAEAYVTYRTDLPKYNQEMTALGNMILSNISKCGIGGKGTVTTKLVKNEDNDDEYKYFDGQNGDYYAIIRKAMKGGYEEGLGDDFRDGSGVSTVLIEHGYLSNIHDKGLMDSDSELKALAKADADAIISFYSLKKYDGKVDITDSLFNSTYYADVNSDLKAAFGYNEAGLRNHYELFGKKEGRVASPVFDPRYYLNKYPDLKNAFGKNYELAYNHFINFGIHEGRIGSKYFDSEAYLSNYGDLRNAFQKSYSRALNHFVNCGISEKRIASKEFNIDTYYQSRSNYERNILGKNYLKYYALASGGNVIVDNPINISNCLFDANVYYNSYSDLQIAFGYNVEGLRNHYQICGKKEGRVASLVFDPVYYLNKYSDLKNAFGDNYELAYNHFVTCGINEGRSASKDFDPVYYLNSYSDLKDVFGNNYSKALNHFVNYGIKEGRSGNN